MTANAYLILASVIGGVLAAGTGWFLDWQRQRATMNKAKQLFVTSILDDLQHSLSLYDKIREEWEKTKVVWFSTLNELRESRQTYLLYKDSVVLIDNVDMLRTIFRYYLGTNEVISQMEYQQQVRELVIKIMADENAEYLNIQNS